VRPVIDSVIAVACSGTSGKRMMERAREEAQHRLRVLRAGPREDPRIVDSQS
jgi:hypothetical protein